MIDVSTPSVGTVISSGAQLDRPFIGAVRRQTGIEIQVFGPASTDEELDALAHAMLGMCERIGDLGGYNEKEAKQPLKVVEEEARRMTAAQLRAVIAAKRSKAGK